MKVLLDTCVWAGAMEELKEAGHDVEWVGHWERDPGDEKILSTAFTNYQVLVTLDKDFGELAVLKRSPSPRNRPLGELPRSGSGSRMPESSRKVWRGALEGSSDHGGTGLDQDSSRAQRVRS